MLTLAIYTTNDLWAVDQRNPVESWISFDYKSVILGGKIHRDRCVTSRENQTKTQLAYGWGLKLSLLVSSMLFATCTYRLRLEDYSHSPLPNVTENPHPIH